MISEHYKKKIFILISVSVIVRIFLANFTELGNDEVYYWTYALYPDLSHFDHPPMVGFMIQLFSFNLFFESELWIRLSSIVLGSVNIWLIYLIGSRINGNRTGFYSAVLYVSSLYGSVITGIFILPDTPQMFFWVLSLFYIIQMVEPNNQIKQSNFLFIAFGITAGLALLSKYTSIFLWIGVFIYVLIYNRQKLKTGILYLSVMISILIFLPVILWNFQNDFISFTFQGGRVAISDKSFFRPDYFLLEILGEFFYNNPINVVIVILSLFSIAKRRIPINPQIKILLSIGLPLIITFLVISLFKRTLPHWTAPGYTTLLIVAAYYLDISYQEITKKGILPSILKYSLLLLGFVVILSFLQINFGLIRFENPNKVSAQSLGKMDISLDIYGWRQIGTKFTSIHQRDQQNGTFKSNTIISHRWFPAANLDYYAAKPNQMNVLAIGYISAIHKYYWINWQRGGFHLGMDAYCITTSHDYSDPVVDFSQFFTTVEPSDTIRIERGGKHVMNAFVYRLTDMKRLPKW
ncbi:MAG: glycosyltransferase family 39 protein [Bacteroidales bacterium]|nr:glycosyltransferase family 39 protein [Bacteroidales bacterium]